MAQATSGSVSTSKYEGRYYTLSWTASQSVANNQSTISWTLKAVGASGQWFAERTLKVVLAGSTVYSKTERVQRYDGTIATGTKVITHDSNGNASFSISIEAAVYASAVNCKGSGSFELKTIARASSITSASNITLGNSCNVKWTPASTSFYYKLKFALGSWSKTIEIGCPGQISEYTYSSYTIPIDVANQITTSTTGTMTAYLYTYSSSSYSTQIGSTSSKTFTVTVPSSVIPTLESVSISIDNSANNIIDEWGVYVAGYSKARLEATASGMYGSTINSYTISGGYSVTQNVETLDYTGSAFTTSGDKTFTIVAKDSRGRSSSSKPTDSIYVYAYSAPKITKFTIARKKTDQNLVVVNSNWTYSSIDGNNEVTATIFYKESSSNTWIQGSDITASKNSAVELDIEFSSTKSFDFRLVVQDSLGEKVQSEKAISTMEVLMDWGAGGKRFSIGKISEKDGFEVAFESFFAKAVEFAESVAFKLKATFEKQIQMKQGSYVHYTVGESGVAGYINIAQIICKGEYANTPIIFHVLQRDAMKNTYSIRFMNDSSSDPSISAFTYEGNKPAYLVKTDTSTWDLYIQKTEKYDAVCVTQLENSYYVNSKFEITWKDSQVTDLPDGYKESTNSTKYRLSQILGTTYKLETSVIAGSNWAISDPSAYLVGNTLRLYFKGTRSSTLSAGNVANETVLTLKITHNGKINGIYNVTSVNGLTGGVVTFNTTDTGISDDTLSVSVMLTAASTDVTEVNSHIPLPVTLNMDAYF